MGKSTIMASVLSLTAIISCGDSMDKKENKSETGVRWIEKKAQEWGAKQKWIVGANFNPSDASNQLDMWQADTWNPELIDKELGWAEDIGMNTMRVYLHYFPYRDDKDAFLERMDQFLEIASKHNIKTTSIYSVCRFWFIYLFNFFGIFKNLFRYF